MKVIHYTELMVKRWWLLPRVKVGVLFDLYAWILFSKESNIDFSDMDKINPDKLIKTVIYYAAISWAKDNGKKRWFTINHVSKWIDNMTRKEFTNIQDTFLKSYEDQMVDNKDGNEEKKK